MKQRTRRENNSLANRFPHHYWIHCPDLVSISTRLEVSAMMVPQSCLEIVLQALQRELEGAQRVHLDDPYRHKTIQFSASTPSERVCTLHATFRRRTSRRFG